MTYRHCSASKELLTGETLPNVDGTPSAAVIRLENIVALADQVRSIAFWAAPSDRDALSKYYVPSVGDRFDRRTIGVTELSEIHSRLKSAFGFAGYSSGGAIPKAWSPAVTLPFVENGPSTQSAIGILFSDTNLTIERHCDPDEISRNVPIGDDLRKAFYDAAQMRRFILPRRGISDGWKWADVRDDEQAYYYPIVGPFMADDGNCTEILSGESYERTGFNTPYVSRTYENGELVKTDRMDGSYVLGIETGYYTSNGVDAFLGDTLVAYVGGSGSYTMTDESGEVVSKQFSFVTDIPATFSSKVMRTSTLYGQIDALYSINFNLLILTQIVEAWLTNNVSGWTSNREAMSFRIYDVAVDSGIVKNYFVDPPDTWTWEPDEN